MHAGEVLLADVKVLVQRLLAQVEHVRAEEGLLVLGEVLLGRERRGGRRGMQADKGRVQAELRQDVLRDVAGQQLDSAFLPIPWLDVVTPPPPPRHLVGGHESVEPGQQLLVAVVGVQHDWDAVVLGHGAHMQGTLEGKRRGGRIGVCKHSSKGA